MDPKICNLGFGDGTEHFYSSLRYGSIGVFTLVSVSSAITSRDVVVEDEGRVLLLADEAGRNMDIRKEAQ